VLVERLPCEDCPELAGDGCAPQEANRCPRWLRWLYGGARDQ
jgi:hypothetical protein